MHKSIYILFFGILISMSSCRKDFETIQSTGTLEFSKETVYLDTVFSNIGSSTYRLKVYNRSNDDISIPTINLAKPDSRYRIMVDGMTGEDADKNGVGDGKVFKNVELLAKDSMYVFIETTINIDEVANDLEFLYTDEIIFNSGSTSQKVNLVTLVRDAIFLYPEKDNDGVKESILLGLDGEGNQVRLGNAFELVSNDPIHGNEFIFTKDKPYVIYGFAGVPTGNMLKIEAGARVYFHSESGIVVQPGASLNIDGDINITNGEGVVTNRQEVTFEGDRLEPDFEDTPGQWGTIWLRDGSINKIDYLTLKNASVGLLSDECSLEIKNSQIYNCSNYGILGRNATINGKNVVINYAGQACFGGSEGGNYDMTHCTFNNNWNSTKQVSVVLNNYREEENKVKTPFALNSSFKNSIIYGSNQVELFLDKVETELVFVTNFDHCLVKFNDFGTRLANDEKYTVVRNEANGNIKNKDPKFKNENTNKMSILDESPAYQKAVFDISVPKDIIKIDRPTNPDIGAYQYVPIPE